MSLVDNLNKSMGPKHYFICLKVNKEFTKRSNNRSKDNTTKWSDIIEVN